MQDMLIAVKRYLLRFPQPYEAIIQALSMIDRQYFTGLQEQPYLNKALPISENQTISQPSTVARMLQILQIKAKDNILEVGSGSGWNAAICAYLANPGKVTTIERIKQLHKEAIKNTKNLEHGKGIKLSNLSFILSANVLMNSFCDTQLKFHKIIFTAGIIHEQLETIVTFASKRLTKNGICLCPQQQGPLYILKNENSKISISKTDEWYAFVPLIID
jgi:protein-L-isoaspartate(D-aspartate) O-methyltransferase